MLAVVVSIVAFLVLQVKARCNDFISAEVTPHVAIQQQAFEPIQSLLKELSPKKSTDKARTETIGGRQSARAPSATITSRLASRATSGSVTSRPASGSIAELADSSQKHAAEFLLRRVTKIASFVQNNAVVLSLLGVHAAMWIGMVSKQLPDIALQCALAFDFVLFTVVTHRTWAVLQARVYDISRTLRNVTPVEFATKQNKFQLAEERQSDEDSRAHAEEKVRAEKRSNAEKRNELRAEVKKTTKDGAQELKRLEETLQEQRREASKARAAKARKRRTQVQKNDKKCVKLVKDKEKKVAGAAEKLEKCQKGIIEDALKAEEERMTDQADQRQAKDSREQARTARRQELQDQVQEQVKELNKLEAKIKEDKDKERQATAEKRKLQLAAGRARLKEHVNAACLKAKQAFTDKLQRTIQSVFLFVFWANALSLAFVPAVNYGKYSAWSTLGGVLRVTMLDFEWIGVTPDSVYTFWAAVIISIVFTFLRWPAHLERMISARLKTKRDHLINRFCDQFVCIFYAGILSVLTRGTCSYFRPEFGFTSAIIGSTGLCLFTASAVISAPLAHVAHPSKFDVILDPICMLRVAQTQTLLVLLIALCSENGIPEYALPVAGLVINTACFIYIWKNIPCTVSVNRMLLFAFFISIGINLGVCTIAIAGHVGLLSLVTLIFTTIVVLGFWRIDFNFDWVYLIKSTLSLLLTRTARYPRLLSSACSRCKRGKGTDWRVAKTKTLNDALTEMVEIDTGTMATSPIGQIGSEVQTSSSAVGSEEIEHVDDLPQIMADQSAKRGTALVVEKKTAGEVGADIVDGPVPHHRQSADVTTWISAYPKSYDTKERKPVLVDRKERNTLGELVVSKVNERKQAFMAYQGTETETEPDFAKFCAFMEVFGTRMAVIYALLCALVASGLVATSYYLSPPGAMISSVSIAWVGALFFIGILHLVKYLRAPADGAWQADWGSKSVDVPVPPLARTMAVVFIACANSMAMFTIAVDRCVDIGGSTARGRVLFATIFVDYICLFASTCNKWRFVVKQPSKTSTIEFEMPRQQDGRTDSQLGVDQRDRGNTGLGGLGVDQRDRGNTGLAGNTAIESSLNGDVASESRGRSDSALELEAAKKRMYVRLSPLVQSVNEQLRSRMPEKFEMHKDAQGNPTKRTSIPNDAENQYWVLKKHDERVLQQYDEKSKDGMFLFKDGKVIVCFDEEGDPDAKLPARFDNGTVAVTKNNKTENQVHTTTNRSRLFIRVCFSRIAMLLLPEAPWKMAMTQ
jgi:hypothetical protein